MVKRYVMKPLGEGPVAAVRGGAVWDDVGLRLRERRAELGFSVDHIAQWAGVSTDTYEAYENGAAIPASVLADAADLLEVSVVWFFHGIAPQEAADRDAQPDDEPAQYRVATVEHRIQALADSFRKLDFEGQQHLLAISRALSQANTCAACD